MGLGGPRGRLLRGVWIYLYAVFTLIVAAVVALVIAVTLAVLHRRTSASD